MGLGQLPRFVRTRRDDFTPASLSNLAIWLDSVDSALSTGGGGTTLASWEDLSGNMYVFTATNALARPAIIEDAFASGTKRGFNFASSYLQADTPITIENGFTMFATINVQDTNTNSIDFVYGSSVGGTGFGTYINSTGVLNYWGDGFNIEADIDTSGTHTLAITHSLDGIVKIYWDGVEVETSGAAYDAPIVEWIGTDAYAYGPDVADIIIYDEAKASQDIERLHAYALNRWF